MKSFRCCAAVLWVAMLAGLTMACDNEAPSITEPEPDSGTGPKPDSYVPVDTYYLTIQGLSAISLDVGTTALLKVRYTKNEDAVPNAAVTFAIKGDSKNSALSTLTALTDAMGVAQTTLTASSTACSFEVEAQANKAPSVKFTVTVSQPVTPPPPVTKLAGTFTLVSNFDVNTNFMGTKLGDALNVLNEFSDDVDDPGQFVVDLIFDNLPADVQQVANLFRSALYPQVNNLLTLIAPQLINDIKSLAADVSGLARRFEITSEMASATDQPGDQLMRVTHRLLSIAWTLKGQKAAYTFNQLGMQNPEATNVALNLTQTIFLDIAEHVFDIKFGAFLLVGLNQLVIPAVKPGAKSLGDLFNAWIDCKQVGTQINKTVNLFGEAFWQAACVTGLNAVAGVVEGQILKIDQDTSSLKIVGKCKLTDESKDYYFDKMSEGLWTGLFTFASNAAAISGPTNNFTGSRTK